MVAVSATSNQTKPNFFLTELTQQNPGPIHWTFTVGSHHKAHLPVFSLQCTFGRGHRLKRTFGDVRGAGESFDSAWTVRIYEHKQLFKPRLFTDNLLTIQLFILRQRPSPSHKLMKSNKALLTNDTEDCKRHTLTLYHKTKYIHCQWLSCHKIDACVSRSIYESLQLFQPVTVVQTDWGKDMLDPLMFIASSLFVSASY